MEKNRKERNKRRFPVKKNQVIITALALMIAVAGYLNFAQDEMNTDSTKALSDAAVEDNETLLDLSQEDTEAVLDVGEDGTDILAANEEETDEDTAEGDTAGAESAEEDSTQEGLPVIDESASELAEELEQSDETPGDAVMTSGQATDSTESESTAASGSAVTDSAKENRDQVRAQNKETLQNIIDSQTVTEEQRQQAVDGLLTMTENAEKEAAAETLLEAKGFANAVVSISEDTVDVVVEADQLTDAQLAQIEDIVKRKTGMSGNQIIITTTGTSNN